MQQPVSIVLGSLVPQITHDSQLGCQLSMGSAQRHHALPLASQVQRSLCCINAGRGTAIIILFLQTCSQ